MKKIASFMVDHIKLVPGLYVSRKDKFGTELVTTFDIRMTSPNDEPVMNTAEVHTIEHLGATFLRNHPEFAEKTVYFGPMGCRPLSDEISSSCVQLVIIRIVTPIAYNLFFIPFILLSYILVYHSFSSRSPAEPPSLHAPSVPAAFQV